MGVFKQFLGIIPARGGSKGLPGKNIKSLCNKPLIAYTIEAALAAKLSKVVVSTDSEEIAEISRSFGAEVILRPPELAGDETPTLPVLQHVLDTLGWENFSVVATLQPTSPLRKPWMLSEALALLVAHPEADSLVSVVKLPHQYNPESIMRLEPPFVRYCSEPQTTRRQDKKTYYARNGAAIYLSRVSLLRTRILGDAILAYEMDKKHSLDIDDAWDFELAELILSSK